jgi:hypothetical protein
MARYGFDNPTENYQQALQAKIALWDEEEAPKGCKYEGMTFHDVVENHERYAEWLVDTMRHEMKQPKSGKRLGFLKKYFKLYEYCNYHCNNKLPWRFTEAGMRLPENTRPSAMKTLVEYQIPFYTMQDPGFYKGLSNEIAFVIDKLSNNLDFMRQTAEEFERLLARKWSDLSDAERHFLTTYDKLYEYYQYRVNGIYPNAPIVIREHPEDYDETDEDFPPIPEPRPRPPGSKPRGWKYEERMAKFRASGYASTKEWILAGCP